MFSISYHPCVYIVMKIYILQEKNTILLLTWRWFKTRTFVITKYLKKILSSPQLLKIICKNLMNKEYVMIINRIPLMRSSSRYYYLIQYIRLRKEVLKDLLLSFNNVKKLGLKISKRLSLLKMKNWIKRSYVEYESHLYNMRLNLMLVCW